MATETAAARDRKWEAEEDLRTLVRAGEIRKDKARFKRAMAMAKHQLKTLEAVSRG